MRRTWAAVVVLCVVGCGRASGSRVRQVGGLLNVAPAAVEFGDVALGKEATATVSLQNDGIVPMTVTQLSQLDRGEFEVRGLPLTLGPGQQTRVAVRYRPPELGTHERSLQLQTDSPDAPGKSIAMRGRAVRGLATLSGDSFDFGAVVMGEVRSQTFSLSNNDGHALTSVRIELPAGGDPAAFTVKPPGDSPLKPGQTILVTIDFKPARLGDFQAVVPVTPCPTCAARNVSLSGRGVKSLLEVQPAAIDFGEVLLGAEASRAISVTNLSHAPLTVRAPAGAGGAFDISLDGATWPMMLAPGQALTGEAHFRPRALGDQAALVSMPASDGAPGALALHGFGIGAVLEATPKSLYVGATAIGTSRSASLLLTNVGLDPHRLAPLRVSNISVVSPDPAWLLEAPTPIDIGEPSGTATVRLTFRPTHAEVSQIVLVIDSNDALHPHLQVPVAALGRHLAPCTLSVQPGSTLDFGPTPLFTPTVQGIELTNTTGDDCIIGDPVLSSSDQAFRWPGGVAPSGRTLPPGGRMSIRVALVTQAAQAYSGGIAFYLSNAAAPSMTIGLRGQGDSGCFYLSPGTVDFGPVTLGCGIPSQSAYAVNHCSYGVTVAQVAALGAPFSVAQQVPFTVAPQSSAPIVVKYAASSAGDDVGTLFVTSSANPVALRVGLTGGTQAAATVLDQWDQSTPKVDLLIVVDNSGSMASKQQAIQSNLDHLWNRIAAANADFHIAVTSSGMTPYTAGWSQCAGGANGGEAGRFLPVDNSHPRMLTPLTPNLKAALFSSIEVGICHWDERFLEPAVAALTDPLVSATKAPGTSWPADGNAGFLRDDARLAILVITDTDDDNKMASPPPVDGYVQKLLAVKHGAKDLISFAAIVPLSNCAAAEMYPTPRLAQAGAAFDGRLFDACDLNNYGAVLENAAGSLMLPLSSFPLSAHPRDPAAIVVAVNGATVTGWSYHAAANRIVFPQSAVPQPGSHITARYEPACQ